jgi:hypothetical protein
MIQDELVYFSYPFVKDEKFKSNPFVHLTSKMILNNSVQRNGGAFRIILNSIFILLDHKIRRESVHDKKPNVESK